MIFFEQWGPFKRYKFPQKKRFTINEIGIFPICYRNLLFFAKFRSHRVENKKVMTESQSQLNAPVLMTEPS